MIYPTAIHPVYRELPQRSLSASELADAAMEHYARKNETDRLISRYRSRGNTCRARALVTALNGLKVERQRFLGRQQQLQSKDTVQTAAA